MPDTITKPPASGRSFPAQAEELRHIRSFIREEAEAERLAAPMVDDIVLAVSEACANSALYSGSGNVRVRWEATDGRVEVSVRDEGVFRSRVPFPELDGWGGGGRGIALVVALMR